MNIQNISSPESKKDEKDVLIQTSSEPCKDVSLSLIPSLRDQRIKQKRSTNLKCEPCNALSHRTALAASESWKEELLQPPSALWVHKQMLYVKQMLVSLPCTQCFVLPSPWLLLSCFKAERFFTVDVTLMQAVPLPTQKSPVTLNLVTVSTFFFSHQQ